MEKHAGAKNLAHRQTSSNDYNFGVLSKPNCCLGLKLGTIVIFLLIMQLRGRKILWLLIIMNMMMMSVKSVTVKVKTVMMMLNKAHTVIWILRRKESGNYLFGGSILTFNCMTPLLCCPMTELLDFAFRYDEQVEDLLDEAYERFLDKKGGSAKQRKRAKQAYSKDDQLEVFGLDLFPFPLTTFVAPLQLFFLLICNFSAFAVLNVPLVSAPHVIILVW